VEQLQVPVRIGIPRSVGGLSDIVNLPPYATAVGLILFGSKRTAVSYKESERDPLMGGITNRIKNWFADIFGLA
ncbi:MAG TPA: cell division protein FtsA, partial [Clostridia bacterium]|nr:cell division protein FtsA [Clostridia bacterium]